MNKLLLARENANNQVAVGVTLLSDWLRWWHGFSTPTYERSRGKSNSVKKIKKKKRKLIILASLFV